MFYAELVLVFITLLNMYRVNDYEKTFVYYLVLAFVGYYSDDKDTADGIKGDKVGCCLREWWHRNH